MGRVVHFEIQAVDVPGAIAFYRDVFGWRIERAGELDYWLVHTGDGPGIDGGILPRRGGPPTPGQAVNAFVCVIEVDDIDAMFARALKAGAREAMARFAVAGVGWLAYVADPAGNIVGMMQTDPNAK